MQGSTRASFTITPHGVHAHVPVMELGNGYILVDIFCRKTDCQGTLYLILLRDPTDSSEGGGYPRYECALFSDWHIPILKMDPIPRRLVNLPTSALSAHDFAQWRDMYISPRPAYRSHLSSDTREIVAQLSIGPAPPFRIKPSTINRLQRECSLYLVPLAPVPVRNTGRLPIRLQFSRQSS